MGTVVRVDDGGEQQIWGNMPYMVLLYMEPVIPINERWGGKVDTHSRGSEA